MLFRQGTRCCCSGLAVGVCDGVRRPAGALSMPKMLRAPAEEARLMPAGLMPGLLGLPGLMPGPGAPWTARARADW